MKKQNEASVQTGHTKTDKKIVSKCPFQLKPCQAKTMNVFHQYQGEYINTFTFRDHGVMHPSSRTNELEDKGAVILTVKKPAIDSNGEEHQGIAHYLFQGWEV